jgi:site-specific recombinase XerC
MRAALTELPSLLVLEVLQGLGLLAHRPLNRGAVDALAEHWQKQQRVKIEMGSKWTDNDLVFPNGYGGIMIPHNITKRSFKRYLVKAGLGRDVRFHDLRHTAATLLLASGVKEGLRNYLKRVELGNLCCTDLTTLGQAFRHGTARAP